MFNDNVKEIGDILFDHSREKETYKPILDRLSAMMEKADEKEEQEYIQARYPEQYLAKDKMKMWITRAEDVKTCTAASYHMQRYNSIDDAELDMPFVQEEKYNELLTDQDVENIRSIITNVVCFGKYEDFLNERNAEIIGYIFKIFQYVGAEGSRVKKIDDEMKANINQVKEAQAVLFDVFHNSDQEEMKYMIDELLSKYFNHELNMYYSPNFTVNKDGDISVYLEWMTDPRMFVDPYLDFQNILGNAMPVKQVMETFDIYQHDVKTFGDVLTDRYLRSTQKNVDIMKDTLAKKGIVIENANMELMKFDNDLVPVITNLDVSIPNISVFINH